MAAAAGVAGGSGLERVGAILDLDAPSASTSSSSTSTSSSTSSSERRPSKSRRRRPKIVLIAGFESFNRGLYERASSSSAAGQIHRRHEDDDDDDDDGDDDNDGAELRVFSDSDIRPSHHRPATATTAIGSQAPASINPEVEEAIREADAVCVSLLFDYDDVHALMPLLERATGPRFVFESATELMALNRVNSFSMAPTTGGDGEGGGGGPPPVVKKILSLFGSSKEEDKLAGYIRLLKVGPDLLKYVPGERARDLRTWLLAYRYWNQGGEGNVRSLVRLIAGLVRRRGGDGGDATNRDEGGEEEGGEGGGEEDLPPLQVTPDVGLIHTLLMAEGGGGGGGEGGAGHRHERRRRRFHFPYDARPKYMESASEYMRWRLSPAFEEMAIERGFPMARNSSPSGGGPPPPRVAVLLYRKHVVTQQRYVLDLIAMMEESGIIPVPIFINGVEAHAIVRDWLTSTAERQSLGKKEKDGGGRGGGGGGGGHIAKKISDRLVDVDAIVSTIGFPLVGGPAGSMEAGRNVALAQELLSSMDVPYVVAAPLLLQSIRQWKDNGVLGLQSGT
jgi:magnesium chelatase subunit H